MITSYFKKPDFFLSVLECSPVVFCPDAAAATLNSMSHPVKKERGRPEPWWPPPACGPEAGDLFNSQPQQLRFIRNSFTHWMLIGGNGTIKRLTVRGEQICRLKKQKMDWFELGMDCVLLPSLSVLATLKKSWVIVIGIMQINHSHAYIS